MSGHIVRLVVHAGGQFHEMPMSRIPDHLVVRAQIVQV